MAVLATKSVELKFEYDGNIDLFFNSERELEKLDVEISRSSGRIFVVDGTNLMNYIREGKVWVLK